MNNHTPNTVGIDISKAHLDAHELPSQRAARFTNDTAGILTEWIGAPCSAWSTSPRGHGTGRWRKRWPARCRWRV